MNIGSALKEIRKKKGLRQFQVCKKAKITQTYLSQLETGAKNGSVQVLERLSKIYGVPVSFIYVLGTEEKDIATNKLHLFRTLSPVIKSLIDEYIETFSSSEGKHKH